MRPGFSTAAAPDVAEHWFNRLVELARAQRPGVEIGRFGAHMTVHLSNDGPVTFWLEAR
jgi:D-tyrosyl-tRNA(Tyr) deacylase